MSSPNEPRQDAMRARFMSPWSFRERLGRFLWYIVQATLFRFSPRTFNRWRILLLRMFGANVAWNCRVRSSVTTEVPWHLKVGAHTVIGDEVILYCLGPVTIGQRVTISQYAHLCAGTHDYTRHDLPLLRPPIVIEDDAWIATDVFVGPGVTVGTGAVVGARSSVFSDLPAWQICVGNPARPIKERKMTDPHSV